MEDSRQPLYFTVMKKHDFHLKWNNEKTPSQGEEIYSYWAGLTSARPEMDRKQKQSGLHAGTYLTF